MNKLEIELQRFINQTRDSNPPNNPVACAKRDLLGELEAVINNASMSVQPSGEENEVVLERDFFYTPETGKKIPFGFEKAPELSMVIDYVLALQEFPRVVLNSVSGSLSFSLPREEERGVLPRSIYYQEDSDHVYASYDNAPSFTRKVAFPIESREELQVFLYGSKNVRKGITSVKPHHGPMTILGDVSPGVHPTQEPLSWHRNCRIGEGFSLQEPQKANSLPKVAVARALNSFLISSPKRFEMVVPSPDSPEFKALEEYAHQSGVSPVVTREGDSTLYFRFPAKYSAELDLSMGRMSLQTIGRSHVAEVSYHHKEGWGFRYSRTVEEAGSLIGPLDIEKFLQNGVIPPKNSAPEKDFHSSEGR